MKLLKMELVTFHVYLCLCMFRYILLSKRKGRTGAVDVPPVLPFRGKTLIRYAQRKKEGELHSISGKEVKQGRKNLALLYCWNVHSRF